eukprot:16235480-Heterocapsa_arctica.AAC.1
MPSPVGLADPKVGPEYDPWEPRTSRGTNVGNGLLNPPAYKTKGLLSAAVLWRSRSPDVRPIPKADT